MTILALGLAIVVAPLTAAVVAEVDEHDAGVASGVYNAVVRVAGLLATAAVGTIAGGALDLGGFRAVLAVAAGLLALGGAIGMWGSLGRGHGGSTPCAQAPWSAQRVRGTESAGRGRHVGGEPRADPVG
jgi:hypothetical protein